MKKEDHTHVLVIVPKISLVPSKNYIKNLKKYLIKNLKRNWCLIDEPNQEHKKSTLSKKVFYQKPYQESKKVPYQDLRKILYEKALSKI